MYLSRYRSTFRKSSYSRSAYIAKTTVWALGLRLFELQSSDLRGLAGNCRRCILVSLVILEVEAQVRKTTHDN